MIRLDTTNWQREIALPLLILIVPMIASVIGPGEMLTLTFPVALAVGFLLRPRQLWPIWLGSVVLLWVVYGLAVLFDLIPGSGEDVEAGETWWSFALEAFVFMAMLVLLPLWIGRLAGRFTTERRTGPGAGQAPG